MHMKVGEKTASSPNMNYKHSRKFSLQLSLVAQILCKVIKEITNGLSQAGEVLNLRVVSMYRQIQVYQIIETRFLTNLIELLESSTDGSGRMPCRVPRMKATAVYDRLIGKRSAHVTPIRPKAPKFIPQGAFQLKPLQKNAIALPNLTGAEGWSKDELARQFLA
jgi:hypothetical protein